MPNENEQGTPMTPTHYKGHYQALGQEAIHALNLEEAATVILREANLTPSDRAVLENAVRIARILRKTLMV